MDYEEESDGSAEDELEWKKHNTWAILVDEKRGGYEITRIEKETQIGEVGIDLVGAEDKLVASILDDNVQSFLKAVLNLAGDSIETHNRIYDLLYGICRSFEEAMENRKKWRSDQATKA